jgi:hypothetical protein
VLCASSHARVSSGVGAREEPLLSPFLPVSGECAAALLTDVVERSCKQINLGRK